MVLTRKISLTMHEPIWPMLQEVAMKETNGNVNFFIRLTVYQELVRRGVMSPQQLLTLYNQAIPDNGD